jgi:hypothetical protein
MFGAFALVLPETGAASAAPSSPAQPLATAHSAAAKAHGWSLPAGIHQVCPTPDKPGEVACFALIRGSGHGTVHPDLIGPSAYQPSDLQSAYNLTTASAADGAGMTVAVVDAGDDPHAATDLAVYRKEWGLPACDTAAGAGCVTKVNEQGKTSPLPTADPTGGWEVEESLDMDMVSAVCPNCHILLVEANSPDIADLGTAENAAVKLGAKFISNSWGFPDQIGESAYDADFNHPGVAITVAAGDEGYGPSYPATSQFVTSVGGTSLAPAPGTARGWTETVWDGTGSGCSQGEAKPAWQTADNTEPDGCLNRTDNDVAAVADPNTGVWIYDSTPYEGQPTDWQPIGGTSASSPIIAAVYALAGTPEPGTYPASYLYQSGHAADLHPITSGSNGNCESYRAYLCHGKSGYNGPAGWGTPNGIAAFSSTATGHTISVANPGTQDVGAGTRLRLAMQAVDSAAGTKLTYAARNLPSGLSISSSGVITGKLPTAAGIHTVTVTATDASGAKGTVSFRFVIVPRLNAAYHRVTSQVPLDLADKCLYDAGNSARNGTKVELWTCDSSAAEQWTYVPDAAPDGAGTLQIHGKCLDVVNHGTANGSRVQLWQCTGSGNQEWSLQDGFGMLENVASGRCLDDPHASTANGVQADIFDCEFLPSQTFALPAGPVLSAIAGKCAEDPGNSSAQGTAVRLEPCDGSAAQKWGDFSNPTGIPSTHGGRCLSAALPVTGTGMTVNILVLEGAPVVIASCDGETMTTAYASDWTLMPDGQIVNDDVNMCLADPGNASANGTKLVLEDCYGDPGEIWAVG